MCRLNHNGMSGNPVRIRDGSATVRGYELSKPLAARSGRREQGQKPEVRIPIQLCSLVPP